ncbi:MAG: hypothetical protein ABI085_08460 [Gemmatimonadaceae bacterium]
MRENLSSALGRSRAKILLALFAAAPAFAAGQGIPVTKISTVATHARRDLVENSTAAMSTRQPGVFFTINDSNNPAVLFAMDTTGADRGTWRVLDAENADWESAAIGTCGDSRKGRKSAGVTSCIYIGDTGDNKERRPSRRIYRAPEPTATSRGASDTLRAEHVVYQYSDGPHDVEAMFVAPNGDIFLITKRPRFDAGRRLRPALVFRLAAAVWTQKGHAIAELIDSLPIISGSAPLRLISDASLSPDHAHLAVRTYTQVFIFATDTITGRVNHSLAPMMCDIVKLGEPQGEGVTWANNAGRLLFTSEGQSTPLHLADCPLPR